MSPVGILAVIEQGAVIDGEIPDLGQQPLVGDACLTQGARQLHRLPQAIAQGAQRLDGRLGPFCGRGCRKALGADQGQQQAGQLRVYARPVVVEHGRQEEVHAQTMGQVTACPQAVAEGMHQPHHGVGKRHARQGGSFRQLQPQLLVLRALQHLGQGVGDFLYRHQGQGVTDRILGIADEGLNGVGHGIHGGGGRDVEGQALGEARIQHRQLGQQEGGGEGHLAPARLILDHRHQRHLGSRTCRGGHHRQWLQGPGQTACTGVIQQPIPAHGGEDVDRLGGVDDGAAAQRHQAVAFELPIAGRDPLHHGGGGVGRDLVPDVGDRQLPLGQHIGQQGGEPCAADPLVGEQQRTACPQTRQFASQLFQRLLARHQFDRTEEIVIATHVVHPFIQPVSRPR